MTRPRRLLREAVAAPTLLVVALCLLLGLPLVALLTPNQDVVVLGQSVSVGARAPQLSISGPAEVVQIGNTSLDLPAVQVYGPIRPQIALGPIVRGDAAAAALDPSGDPQSEALQAVVQGFLRWFAWGATGVVVAAVALSALVGILRVLVVLHREGRRATQTPVPELRHRLAGATGRMTIIAVTVSLLAWAASGTAAVAGTAQGLAGVRSLTDLVGSSVRSSPEPAGPTVAGVSGAVIGDSRASRVGGPPTGDGGADAACERSADSLAVELGLLRDEQVLNLACSGASIPDGLRGSQRKGELELAPQVGRLKNVQGLDYVVVAIGPNDLSWSDFLQYCYGLVSCDDRLTAGEFEFRMAVFDRDYGALLEDLAALDDDPQVVIMTSYDAFAPGADDECADFRGPAGFPGLDDGKVELLADRNAQLNEVLAAGAEKYGFTVVQPNLTLLCGATGDGLGPDLQGLDGTHPFHPTAVGSLRLASAVSRALE